MAALLEIRDLEVVYPGARRGLRRTEPFRAVDGIGMVVREGTTHALVGESGSGKSTGRSRTGRRGSCRAFPCSRRT